MKHLWFVAKILITFGLIYGVFQSLVPEWNAEDSFRQVLGQLKVQWLLPAIFLLALSFVLSGIQWWMMLKKQGIYYPLSKAIRIYFTGLFFNNFLLGSVGGDIKKVYDVYHDAKHFTGGIAATLFDRVLGLFVINLFCVLTGFYLSPEHPELRPYLLPSVWIFLCMILFFMTLFSARVGRLFERLLLTFLSREKAAKIVKIWSGFQEFRKDSFLLKATLFSALIQSIRVYLHWIIGLAMGMSLPVVYYFYFIPLIGMVSALPISIGGFGPREYIAQDLFSRVGIGGIEAVSMQLIGYVMAVIISAFGGLEFIFGKRQNLLKKKGRDVSSH